LVDLPTNFFPPYSEGTTNPLNWFIIQRLPRREFSGTGWNENTLNTTGKSRPKGGHLIYGVENLFRGVD